MSTKLLISYRRQDSAAMTGRICDRLVREYGRKAVFLDVDSIPFGTDFRSHIDAHLQLSSVVIAIIGTEWLGRTAGEQSARIVDDDDPIRVEIGSALAHKTPIVPVLVNGAKMPKADQLPDEIKPLAYINAIDVDSGRDFHSDVDDLVRTIGAITGKDRRRPAILRWAVPLCFVLIGAAGLGYFLWIRHPRTGPVEKDAAVQVQPTGVLRTDPQDFCRSLKKIVAVVEKGLQMPQPASDARGDLSGLPGFADCQVRKLSELTYVCEGATAPDKASADAALKTNAEMARTCLDKTWFGPSNLNGNYGLSRLETGDSIMLTKHQIFSLDGTITYSPSFLAWRHVEPVEAIVNAAVPKDFCPDLGKIVASAKDGFQAALGYKKGSSWTSRMSIKGFDDCRIRLLAENDPTKRYLSCGVEPFKTVADASSALETVAGTLETCLPKDWSKEKRRNYKNLPKTTFHAPNEPVEVELRLFESGKSWSVKLDVNMD